MRVDRQTGELVVSVTSEEETVRLGKAIASAVGPGDVLALVGPLGAGKTRLSRAIAEALGVDPGAIASPTFVLIHEYEGRLPVYHFDAYRLDHPDAFDALGPGDYFGRSGICLVEWADTVADRLPDDSWWLRIDPTGLESRRILLRAPAPAIGRIAESLEVGGPDSDPD
ncbi:tRNA (adenosine(37)-N6)-threonylcarbamoyltransferase complex ATPase subunit type 1 TsaE [Tautonia sociabilis]|uniref:tRNA threonylcarbamoyladenosine biosynthesis protein TsaE n=2 Tax=Tautonia sociabilis TaxID=2080755 RepID=A0A432MJM3_9BACT|nr:tRNA (adenosine(37)-N6)-threonylcarbamoyltransferase complex ATPase subunit type 1 TsaE [Tautonia sociabilis]